MLVLDASVLIAYLDRADAHFHVAVSVLDAAAADGMELVVNPVTLAEALVGPTRDGRAGATLTALAEIGVREVPLPADAARMLARLRVAGLRMPDCCVLATAIDAGAAVSSFDERLLREAAAQGVPVYPEPFDDSPDALDAAYGGRVEELSGVVVPGGHTVEWVRRAKEGMYAVMLSDGTMMFGWDIEELLKN